MITDGSRYNWIETGAIASETYGAGIMNLELIVLLNNESKGHARREDTQKTVQRHITQQKQSVPKWDFQGRCTNMLVSIGVPTSPSCFCSCRRKLLQYPPLFWGVLHWAHGQESSVDHVSWDMSLSWDQDLFDRANTKGNRIQIGHGLHVSNMGY